MMHCGYFHTTRNGNHSSFLTPTMVSGQCRLPSEICAQSHPPPFEKRRLRPISARNFSTISNSEKKFNYNKYKVDHGVCTLPLSALKGGSKSDFFLFFEEKSTADRLKRCQLSSPLSVINIWWSAAMLIASPSRSVFSS